MINHLPGNLLRIIFHKLPEKKILQLHNTVCKTFNTIIEGNDTYPPIIDGCNQKYFSTYKIVIRFANLKGGNEIKYTLDQTCRPILREGNFFKNLFKCNYCTEKNVQWVVKQINDFAENAVKSANKETVSSMFLALQRVQLARRALHQIDFIAYHQGIKNSNVDHKKLEELPFNNNWGLKKTLKIQGKTCQQKLEFSVCLKKASSEGFHGSILIHNSSSGVVINFGTEIGNKDLVIFTYPSMSENLKIAVNNEIALLAKNLPCKEFKIRPLLIF